MNSEVGKLVVVLTFQLLKSDAFTKNFWDGILDLNLPSFSQIAKSSPLEEVAEMKLATSFCGKINI